MLKTYQENDLVLLLLKNGSTVAGRYVGSLDVTNSTVTLRTPVQMVSQPDERGRVAIEVAPYFPIGLCVEASNRDATATVNATDIAEHLTPTDVCEKAYTQVTSGIQLAR